jgi:hypothetical protein
MSLFSSILVQLKQKIDVENAYKDVVIRVVKEIIGVSIDTESILSLKDGVLVLKVHPTLRGAIILKQPQLIETLQKNNLSVQTIR